MMLEAASVSALATPHPVVDVEVTSACLLEAPAVLVVPVGRSVYLLVLPLHLVLVWEAPSPCAVVLVLVLMLVG
jgi:hypothetical protein